jgi:glyoxylase-like metal-dependent hydrolase (beta-lactamase superfamily II)
VNRGHAQASGAAAIGAIHDSPPHAAGSDSTMLHTAVAPGIHRIEDAYTNWYLVEGDDGLTIVDAGVPSSWASLQDALRRLGRRPDELRALVLTHAHFDHVGFAERARRELGIPVYVHEDDAPLTRHPWRYDHERPRSVYFVTQVPALPIVATFVRHRAFWPPPIQEIVRFGDDGGALPVPGAPRVVRTPGHTIGHCSLHFPDRDAVIAGDAVVTLDPYTARRGPRLVARAATADVERNTRTLDALVATGARVVLTGHGEPWTEGVEAAVVQARAAGAA